MEEVCFEVTYELAGLLLRMTDYHDSIIKSVLEMKAKEEKEMMKEKETLERLKIRVLLYLGNYSENANMYFKDEEILFLERLCYFFFSINRNVMKVEKKIINELEQFHMQLNEWVMIVQGDESKYLN